MAAETITIQLTAADVRDALEKAFDCSVIRSWISANEYAQLPPDHSRKEFFQLSDGRYAFWRPKSFIDTLIQSNDKTSRKVGRLIIEREIADDVI